MASKLESSFVGPFCKALLKEGFVYDRVETRSDDGFPDIISYSKQTGKIAYVEAKVCDEISSFVIPIKRKQLLFLRDHVGVSPFLKPFVLVFFEKSQDSVLIPVHSELSFYSLMLERLSLNHLKKTVDVVHCLTRADKRIFEALHQR